jgi:hypothetical protein
MFIRNPPCELSLHTFPRLVSGINPGSECRPHPAIARAMSNPPSNKECAELEFYKLKTWLALQSVKQNCN